ncbi:hypothetical protein HZC34_00675 [Candidatus Saganbacteria bacterium]|nr:hypothetical protein [Candidatus Saganbacteria bacterium]
MNIQIQNLVVKLHGPDRVAIMHSLTDELLGEEGVRRAINYNVYYGDPEAKQVAIELASKMKVLTPQDIESLSA